MLLLQTDFVNRGFETSADTVYGLLVAGLAIVVFSLTGAIVYLFKDYKNISNQAITGLNATADRLERIEKILTEHE